MCPSAAHVRLQFPHFFFFFNDPPPTEIYPLPLHAALPIPLLLDERFPLPHAGVADAYTLLAFYGFRPPRDVMPRAKAAAQRALALDDALAEAHSSMGFIHLVYDWDWAAAERELRRAIALDPRYLPARSLEE